jgi:hypothetical protein
VVAVNRGLTVDSFRLFFAFNSGVPVKNRPGDVWSGGCVRRAIDMLVAMMGRSS